MKVKFYIIAINGDEILKESTFEDAKEAAKRCKDKFPKETITIQETVIETTIFRIVEF